MRTTICLLALVSCCSAAAVDGIPAGPTPAVIDLATPQGVALVGGQWRYADARIVESDFPRPGPDRKASGPPGHTYDVTPHAGAIDFDDSGWTVIDPGSLPERRGGGK